MILNVTGHLTVLQTLKIKLDFFLVNARMSLCSESFQYSVCAKAVSLVPCNYTYLTKVLKCETKYRRKLLEITVTTWVLRMETGC